MNKQHFSLWLREQMRARGLTTERLARAAGVSTSTIDRILGEHWQGRIQRDTVTAIADALGVPASEALRIAGYGRSASYRCDITDLIAETAGILRDVPEQYYSDAVRFLRGQLEAARELFICRQSKP